MKEPIVILKKDGTVIEANKAFLDFFDWEKEKLIGKNSHDVMPLKVLYESIAKCKYDKTEKIERVTFGSHVLDVTVTPIMSNNNLNFFCIVFRDISNFLQLEQNLIKRNKELGIINTLSGAFISSGDINSVFMDLLEKVLIVSDLSLGWIVINENRDFVLKGVSGASLKLRSELEKGNLNFLYEEILKSDEPLYILESKDIMQIDLLKKEGIMFFCCIPLRLGAEVMGFLVLASRVDLKFDFDKAALFSLIGNNISLIIDKIKLFQESQRLAVTDAMTGVYNVRYFYDALHKEIARARRYHNTFSLVLFDIDDFKALNDAYGHQAGDNVLRSLAAILKDASRKTDIVARYGGEEFILILPNTPRHEALNLANRIKERVEKHNDYLEGHSLRITVSGGIATFPEDAKDSKSLLYSADMAMYEAKAKGKNQIRSYKRRINEAGI